VTDGDLPAAEVVPPVSPDEAKVVYAVIESDSEAEEEAEPTATESAATQETEPVEHVVEQDQKSVSESVITLPVTLTATSKTSEAVTKRETTPSVEVGASSNASSTGEVAGTRRSHLNPRLQCPHCTYTCKRPSRMADHQRRHSGERPFQCDQVCFALSINI
jgi:hypothetical protein